MTVIEHILSYGSETAIIETLQAIIDADEKPSSELVAHIRDRCLVADSPSIKLRAIQVVGENMNGNIRSFTQLMTIANNEYDICMADKARKYLEGKVAIIDVDSPLGCVFVDVDEALTYSQGELKTCYIDNNISNCEGESEEWRIT